MSELVRTHSTADAAPSARAIAYRTTGRRHGPITRMMSPGDLGELVKPFVFLDLLETDSFPGRGFPPHPHSGIATLTLFLQGDMTYADSTGKAGALSAGAVEWMRAGAGVWHAARPAQGRPILGYQLWIALPPALELAAPESLYLDPGLIRSAGPARVVLGQYEGVVSPIPFDVPMTYLHVRLQPGQRWRFCPGRDHDVAWLALNSGRLQVAGAVLERALAVFEDGDGPIDLLAEGAVELVIGSARKHAYPLIAGQSSIHTTQAALMTGERTIAALARSPALDALRPG
jgi:redox-sensitive bicupin YhaK (pirin superfamily)